eukprot:CAMPEP_0173401536 /NCGR_PEP_ID=MMETSP1356-20130122/51187_1 /TAXON_ID=77927 ORGANISM="Hemiselmis virescens, Strain PCC157" /NCGR_SAMPLE_ID=MMETSP1356 /ASSEMBLY_ACC=CAM_ASM_000847 /LENGTH=261 /DNA_ID=CAMNT_0014361689 /DNA_START=39 /DNA_END=822 /DNA_ORIENTATION=+
MYFSKQVDPLLCVGLFLVSCALAIVFAGDAAVKKPAGKKPVKKTAAKKAKQEDSSDEEGEPKEIGLGHDPKNVLPSNSRRKSQLPERFADAPSPTPKAPTPSKPSKAKSPAKGKRESDVFLVDRIVDRRELNGQVLYLVKWKGYGMDQSTWEPIKNLNKVMDLVEEYEDKLDAQNKAPPLKKKSLAKTPAKPKATPSKTKATPSKATPSKEPPASPAKTPVAKRSTRKSVAPKSAAKSPKSSPKKASPVKNEGPPEATELD